MQSQLKSIKFFLFFSVVVVFALSGCDSKTEPPPKPKAVGQKIDKGPKSTAAAGGRIDRSDASAGGRIDRSDASAGGRIDRSDASAGGRIDRSDASAGGRSDRSDASAEGRSDRSDASAEGRSERTLGKLPEKPSISSPTAEMGGGLGRDSAVGTVEKTSGNQIASVSNSLGQPVALPEIDKGPPPYDPTGKIDPFMPLFKDEPEIKEPEPVKQVKKTEKRIPRTPLERIAIGQLQLVGVIQAESGNKGLVQESSGKGYIVSKGTYIGTNGGRVTEIFKDKIVVEEEVQDILGKLTIQKRELKLQKPFGEN